MYLLGINIYIRILRRKVCRYIYEYAVRVNAKLFLIKA